jgi:hypothetical protein
MSAANIRYLSPSNSNHAPGAGLKARIWLSTAAADWEKSSFVSALSILAA